MEDGRQMRNACSLVGSGAHGNVMPSTGSIAATGVDERSVLLAKRWGGKTQSMSVEDGETLKANISKHTMNVTSHEGRGCAKAPLLTS